MKCLLIDIGSTSIKWSTYNAETCQKSDASATPFPTPINKNAPFYEVDAEQIYQKVLTIIKNNSPVDAIYFCVQMHGYLLGNINGEVLTPFISWQDKRSSLLLNGKSYWEQLPITLPPESGTIAKPNSPICGLYTMQHLQPELFSKAKVFFTLGSYISFRLTGVNATHITDAAASGLYNKDDGTPQYNFFPGLKAPEVLLDIKPVGNWNNSAVFCPVGDQQASVLGSGLVYKAQYLLNLGTAAQLCAVSDSLHHGDLENRPYFREKNLCTVSGLPGGREISAENKAQYPVSLLLEQYKQALIKLPERKAVVVIGGVTRHYYEFVSEICSELQLPCTIRPESTALDGLIKLINGGMDFE